MLLKPYSLGHELWLLRENNPIVQVAGEQVGGRSPAHTSQPLTSSLPSAVLICCQSWTELKRMRSDRLLGLKLWIWRRRIQKKAAGKRYELGKLPTSKPHTSYLDEELAKFLAYRNDGLLELPLSQVTRTDRGPAPRLPGTPFLLRLQQWVMTHFGLTEAEAWDYPAGLAKIRWSAHWEAEGGLEVFNAHDAEEADFIRLCEAHGGPSAVKHLREKGIL